MSDAEQNLEVENTEVVDYKSLYEETKQKLETVAAHKDKLYQETKKAKADREEASKAAQLAEEEKAKRDGEFEKLWQTAKQEKDDLLQKMQQLTKYNRQEKLQINAMKIATELADGDNAELLSEFVVRNLDRMADEAGSLGDDVLKAIRDEFKNNEKFKSLLRSSKATGGGAAGNVSSAQQSKTIDRQAFDKLQPGKKMEFIKNGGSIVDQL